MKELICGLLKRHDFIMKKANVVRCVGNECSDWETENTYILECINCGAVYLGHIAQTETYRSK